MAGEMAIAAGSTLPTGMHSCSLKVHNVHFKSTTKPQIISRSLEFLDMYISKYDMVLITLSYAPST